jgi:sterol desaturase/sphingolipid hydroxylase (fatty acid hydroxylase superfamily)
MDLMIMVLPVFAALMVAEATFTSVRGHNVYALKDFGGSMSQLGINILVRLALGGAVIGLHFFLYRYRIFEVPAGPWGWLLTFIVIDFVFYGYHRASHRMRFLWCAHVVHHSSEHMNLGTALRQSPTGPFTKVLFYWPLPLLGFDPLVIASAGALATLYGFWTHTKVVKKLWAPLEWLFVTPSHHRAHHGSNPEYIDKNYGNFLIIWDRLFGTFEPEAAPVQYGLTKNIGTYNPLRIAFTEWVALFKDSLGSTSLRGFWKLWLLPAQSSGGVSADHKS